MLTVKDLMSRELHTLKPTDTIQQARELMLEKRIRHVPIIDEDSKFVGLLTKRDVLAISVSALADIDIKERNELESHVPISEVMISEVVIAQENTALIKAANFMLQQKHGCLPVFKDEKLIGILTESDFVRLSLYLMKKTSEYQ
ncbi:CBS domain-containing protein [Candidatus Halobeggiatoa sp. HSG11]|nr:CBS domain-containing protein [Candidatus Halobeggiatoa sp. HSG11]